MSDNLRDVHFSRLASLIEGHTGIQLPLTKRAMLEGRLSRRVRALKLETVRAYGDALFSGELLDREFDFLVDCATTNKTDFFREPSHFDFLVREAVPLIASRRNLRETPMKIWSAACSVGAEAYTAAMVLAARGDVSFAILGTDICRTVLETARTAIYPASMVDDVSDAFCERFVMRSRRPDRNEVRIVPELRARCRFEPLNLMDEHFDVDRDIDVILCRNVLIYFKRDVQHQVLLRLIKHLRPGGFLIVGHAETFSLQLSDDVRQIMPTIFQRVGLGSSLREAA